MLFLTHTCTRVQHASMHKEIGHPGWWKGPIENRARAWAEEVFKRTRGTKPWPEFGGLVVAHAKQAIADMLPTAPPADEMIAAAYKAAKARYEELCKGGK